jgi:O-antigen ligase
MKNITLKLFPFLISLVFLFPILKENLSSFSVILLFVNTLIYIISTKNYNFFKFQTFLLTIPFWIILLSSITSKNFEISLIHIQRSSLFLIMPVMFSIIPDTFFDKKKIELYILVLKNVCLIIAFIYVFSFLINVPSWQYNVVFNNESRFRNYIYNDFKLFIIHPTYYTSVLILCSAHSFDLALRKRNYFQLIYVVCFLLITIFLLSKLNLVFMALLIIVMVFIRGAYKFKTKLFFAISLTSLIIVFCFFTPGIKERFTEIFNSFNLRPKNEVYDSTNLRKAIFDSSIKIAKENWAFGVGFENLQDKLNQTYKESYSSSFYENHNYMTHNYYFYIFLSSGIIGLLFYLFYLINIIIICVKSNVFLFNVVLLNALIVCFIEDYFFRQYGILYFNLMLMCFVRYSEKNTK